MAAVESIVQQSTLIITTAEMSRSAMGQFVYFMCTDIALIPNAEVSEKYSYYKYFFHWVHIKGSFSLKL